METRPLIALYAETHDVIKDDNAIAKRREIGYLLLEHEKDAYVVTTFAPTVHYIKEVIQEEIALLSFSPAASKEEHENIYKLPLLSHEAVVYTGLGIHHSTLLLLQSAHVIIALDDKAYTEALHVSERTGARVYLLGGIGKKDVKTFFLK